MISPSLNLELKSVDLNTLALNSIRAKSSLSKISMKKTMPRSKSKEQESKSFNSNFKLKTLKNNENLGLEATFFSKKHIEGKIYDMLNSIKKLKKVPKELKNKDVELEGMKKELIFSDNEIQKMRKKVKFYEDVFNELYHHCKVNDDEGILKLFNSCKNKNKKFKLSRNSLSIEELILKPETTKNTVKTSRNSNIRSPYDSCAKLLVLSSKRIKKSVRDGARLTSFTPSIKSVQNTNFQIDEKMHKIYERLEMLLKLLEKH